MNRKLKALALALGVVFAMSAVGVSAASAASYHSGSASGTTFLTGTQIGTNSFDLANGTSVKCTTIVYDASYAGTTASELTIVPTYSGCTAAGQAATAEINCHYKATTPTLTDLFGKAHQVTHTQCTGPSVNKFKVPTAGCEIIIAEQTPTNPLVDLTSVNSGTPNQDDITLKSTVEGVHYTTVGGGICGAAGQGKLTGEITLKAYSNAAHTSQVDLWVA